MTLKTWALLFCIILTSIAVLAQRAEKKKKKKPVPFRVFISGDYCVYITSQGSITAVPRWVYSVGKAPFDNYSSSIHPARCE